MIDPSIHFHGLEMFNNGKLLRITAIVFFLAAPAVTVRVLSDVFSVPNLLPLDVTKESLAAARKGSVGERSAIINVTVGWGRDWSGTTTQDRLRDFIAQTLDAQTKFYHIELEEVPGDRIDVSFEVGANNYGPFPPSQMAAGIQSALIALRMINGPENR